MICIKEFQNSWLDGSLSDFLHKQVFETTKEMKRFDIAAAFLER